MQLAPDFPSEPAGTEIAYWATVALYNAGSGGYSAITSGTVVLLVTDGADGKATVIELPPAASSRRPPSTRCRRRWTTS